MKEKIKDADIIICAVGKRHIIKGEYIKDRAIILDLGTNQGIKGEDKK